MVTSLAAQLSKGVSLNAPLLADRSKRKRAESYLFTSREADQHDLYSIHALGVTGLSKLKTLDVTFAKYEENLFSDASRDLDRTLQSVSKNAELDRTLGSLLRDLGPYLLEAPSSKVLEWLVRRFRVNEFNLDDVMALFLPYHDTPHFTKMISIMHLGESRLWSFLASSKAAGKILPRSLLVAEMLRSVDLARFVVTLLPEFLAAGRAHRALVGFAAGVTVDYLTQMKTVPEDILAFVLPVVIKLFSPKSNADCALAGYITLAILSQRCRFSSEALVALLAEMVKGQRHIKPAQFLPLAIAVIGPQDEVEQFSGPFVDTILELPEITKALPDCLRWIGVEKLVIPLLPDLIRRVGEKLCFDFLDSILSSPDTPRLIVTRCTLLCVDALLHSPDRSDPTLLQLLSAAYQRRGTIFSDIHTQRLKTEEDAKKRLALEGIFRSIAVPWSSTTEDRGKWIISSQVADVGSRISSVRELKKALRAGDAEEDLYDALRSRVMDTDLTVIETLYDEPELILPAICNLHYIESVSRALVAPGISRAVMKLHFAFAADEICVNNAELIPTTFERIYLPYILFTKPRQKTAALVWETLRHSKLADYELLVGCMDIVFPRAEADPGLRTVEDMGRLNLAVSTKIAGNIVASNAYRRYLDMLLGLLASSDPHTILTTYLLLRSLLHQLSGEHSVDAAYRILAAMSLKTLDELHGVTRNAGNLQEVMSDDLLSKSLVLKPNSPTTMRILQATILAFLPVVQRPVGVKIDWFGSRLPNLSDTRGKHFVELARAIYALANSSSKTGCLSSSILRALFLNLREEALLFLAGVWSASSQPEAELHSLSRVALCHGAAFLMARSLDTEHPQDFQVILPSLLIALQSKQRLVREAAMDCVGIIDQSSSSRTTFSAIYAFDSVYGSGSDGLQYLEQSDLSRYVSSLNARREHFINDSDYLGVFQQEILCGENGESRKEAGYKYRVLCYTLSHVIAWSSLEARVALLDIVKNIASAAKLRMLLPLIQKLVPGKVADASQNEEHSSVWGPYCRALLLSLDESTAEDLNETGSGSWLTLMHIVRYMFSTGASTSIRETIIQQLRAGLFGVLIAEHQLEICIVLIDVAAAKPDYHSMIKEALGSLLVDTTLTLSLLTHFQQSVTDSSQRAPKRLKVDTSSQHDGGTTEPSLRPLTVLVEILVANTLPGSLELMSYGIDVLARISHSHSSKSDANYLMQLLMSMLESQASSLTGNITLSPGSVRVEILVELLRASDNPQTFNQALLLIASLARLSPETVMQNIMPVFTFMGSNVFHRDDSYTFRVVQKTIESIVPAMICSLKMKHNSPLELQIASRDFLRVFTDASSHVPRHRRTQFFNYLVEVLGPEEFTVPICLLLVDKLTSRVIRQKPGEAASALNLPLAILQANFKAIPFKVVAQMLRETSRLLLRITEPEATLQDAFLESRMDNEQTSSTATRSQIQAILIFVDRVLQQSPRRGATVDENSVQESVQILLVLSDPNFVSASSLGFPDISQIALKTLGNLLRVISVREFIASVATIIASKKPAIESGALNLLSSKLVDITPNMRQEISPTILNIIDHICGSLNSSQDLPTMRANFKVLSAISKTVVNNEMSALTKAIPIILQVVARQKSLTDEALACILPLSTATGPRILPFFRDVVELCRSVLTQAGAIVEGKHSGSEENAQSILLALLSSLSQFWGIDELVGLTVLSLDTRSVSLLLRKTLAKRISTRQLLPALFRVWPDVSTTVNDDELSRKVAFFDLLKRVLRRAAREDIHERLRNTFALFLEAFDIVGKLEHVDAEPYESSLLGAFVEVVTKLNDAAFKPLFRRLFDWAFGETAVMPQRRQITFCRVLSALIRLLKGLITPYMSIVLVPLLEKLDSRNEEGLSSGLWQSAIELFQTSIDLDEGAFWKTDKLRRLMPALTAQIDLCPSLKISSAPQLLKACLNTFAAAADDDSLLKALNLEVLLKTRSDDAKVRLLALECARHMWHGSGDKLIGFVSDVVTFIAECADDENDDVAKEARKLKRTVESRCGSLDKLMQ